MSTTTPGAFAAALQEKRRRDRRRRLWRWSGGGAALFLAAFLVWLLAFSPFLQVARVDVSGTELLSVEDVEAAAAVPLNSALVLLDTDGIEDRVSRLPAVRSVAVRRSYPQTVHISVVERTIVYQRLQGAEYEWVDAEGVVFHTTDSQTPDALLAVTDEGDVRLLKDVATVVSHIPPELEPRVARVQAKAVDRITLELDGGELVVWGSADQSELKADVLAVLLQVDAKLYDVSAPSHPTTK